MIAYIKGEITEKTPTHVIIETGGIGYHINISLNTYEKIRDKNECLLHTYFHVKEDLQQLFGFFDQDERTLFELLISVSGIGPTTGRMILSSMKVEEAKNAILLEDEKRLSSVKGIGGKTAKRVILELKDKVSILHDLPQNIADKSHNTLKEEALSALTTLGFSRAIAEKAVSQSIQANPELNNVEDLIKSALGNT